MQAGKSSRLMERHREVCSPGAESERMPPAGAFAGDNSKEVERVS
jgi:hypothetical protein